MSRLGGILVKSDDTPFLDGFNTTGSQLFSTESNKTSVERVADWFNENALNKTQDSILLQNNSHVKSIGDHLQDILIDSTTQIAQKLEEISSATKDYSNISQPEVTFRRPEVDVNESGFGTEGKVILGAALMIGCLAIIAIGLRFIRPWCRVKKTDPLPDEEKKIADDSIISKISGFTNLGSDLSSDSSGLENSSSQDCSQSTGSTPITDWSDISGDKSKSSTGSGSSSGESDENLAGKNTHFTKFQKSRQSNTNEDGLSAKSSPGVRRKNADEQVPSVSSYSNLSHLRNTSDSRLSLNSMTSDGSNTTFPIPSRDIVRQMHKDKDRRYPSSTIPAKKDKHARLATTEEKRNDNK